MKLCRIASLSLVLLACKQDEAPPPAADPAKADEKPSEAAAASDAQDKTAAMQRKLQPYIACMNSLSERAFSSHQRYGSWVDEKTGPTGKERQVNGTYTLSDGGPKSCADGVAAAKKIPPSLGELEEAGQKYADAVVALAPVLKEAADYYDQGNYKDDKMKKGRELHPRLVAAWEAFGAADKALRVQVTAMNRKAREDELAGIEKAEGRKLHYLIQRTMLDAETLVEAGEVRADELAKLDRPRFTQLLESYEKSAQELSTYADAHPDEADKVRGWSLLSSYVKQYLTAGKELMRRARDKVPYSAGDKENLGGRHEWMVQGSPGQLLDRYNKLVEASNSLR